MNEKRYKATEDIGTDHESVSYFSSYDSACHYCRGLYNTIYRITEVEEDGDDTR